MAKKIIVKRDLKKQKYSVTLYFHTNITLDAIYADSEKEAIEIARAFSENPVNQKIILEGLQEDSSPDVEPITD